MNFEVDSKSSNSIPVRSLKV